ncbi:hypothetical protein Btru_002844 [Bulinus truncatus]|nr:hypothetical protein Btru_002844 [Bulinus truncatus]
MARFLQTVTLLSGVLLAIHLPGPCTAERIECKKGMQSKEQYVNIYSTDWGVGFLCDTKTDGGGWIVIQRRVNKDTSFTQNWEAYKNGFGTVCSDYWMGNKYIHEITTSGKFDLRVDMLYKFTQHFAHYILFSIEDEDNNYALHVDGFNGTARDNLAYHDRQPFSTPDRDNDATPEGSCAHEYNAGWWYKDCHETNLNGRFEDVDDVDGQAVTWESITEDLDTLSAVEMKIRKHV